jgi:hypothetical protein
MPILRSAILVLLVSLVSAVPARAEGFISPWIAYNFGGDSANCLGLTNCEEHRNNYGVSAGAMGGVFGAEFDFGYAPDFFGKLSTGSNAVLTVMGNMMLIIPAGPIRPYGLIGLGLIRPHAQLNSSLADVSQNTLGYDIGGGINIFIVHSFGLRGDVRHMHTLQDVTLGVFQSQPLDFWRASAGVTFRF